MQKHLIAAIVLCSAYAVANTLEESTPPVVMQPVATATVPEGEAGAVVNHIPDASKMVVESIPSEEASAPAPVPQAVAQVAHLPAAGGFCANGNCGPAQARRVYQVQRPQRAWLFRGLLRGRR